jgi:hypothetical protein
MLMKARIILLISLAGLILIFSSCQNRNIRKKSPIKLLEADYVLNETHKNQTRFEWFSGKAKVDFIAGKKKNPFTVQMRIKRDSTIWVSVSTGIGIEGARLLLTQDSVKYLNRIDKTYFISDYTFLSNLINTEINFGMIQALLLAKDFSWYDYQDLKVRLDKRLYQIESTNKHQLKHLSKNNIAESTVYYQSLWISPETFKIQKLKIKEIGNENKKIAASYKQYRSINKQLFPYEMNIELNNEKGMRMEMVYYRINFDDSLDFPYSIPSKYTPIEL